MASPTHEEGHDSPDYYYLFVGLSAIALLLFAFNVMAIRCCASCQFVQAIRRFLHLPGGSEGEVEGDGSPQLAPVSKYEVEQVQGNELDTECSVCLSVFQDGEEVRQLPQCKHLFHAPCIDMWLHSHSNCPLCRANVSLPTSRSPSSLVEGETRQRLPMLSGGTAILVVTLM